MNLREEIKALIREGLRVREVKAKLQVDEDEIYKALDELTAERIAGGAK